MANVIQFVGMAILVFSFGYCLLLMSQSLRTGRQFELRESVERELLSARTREIVERSRITKAKEEGAWNGYRKFRVSRKIEEAKDQCSFYLTPHDGRSVPPFDPGQFLTFRLDIPDQNKPVIRCYSLSEAPKQDHYRVTIKRVPPPRDKPEIPPGLSSNYFHDLVEEGKILDVRAPGGHFFQPVNPGEIIFPDIAKRLWKCGSNAYHYNRNIKHSLIVKEFRLLFSTLPHSQSALKLFLFQ